MFRFGLGYGFGSGARKVFGAILKAKGTVVASLAKLFHQVAATVTGSAVVPETQLKVISRVAATVAGEGVVEAELPSYNPYYMALLNKLSADSVALPSDSQKVKDNALVSALDTSSDLIRHKGLYIFGWHHFEAALYNWANPSVFKCSFVGSIGASDHTAGLGYRSVAASALNTGINPSSTLVLNDIATLWMWADGISSKNIYMGGFNPAGNNAYVGVEGGIRYSRLFTTDAEASGSIGANKNLLAFKRINNNDVEIIEDNVVVATIPRSFNFFANTLIYFLGLHISGSSPYVPQTGVRVYAGGFGTDINLSNVYNAVLAHKS